MLWWSISSLDGQKSHAISHFVNCTHQSPIIRLHPLVLVRHRTERCSSLEEKIEAILLCGQCSDQARVTVPRQDYESRVLGQRSIDFLQIGIQLVVRGHWFHLAWLLRYSWLNDVVLRGAVGT